MWRSSASRPSSTPSRHGQRPGRPPISLTTVIHLVLCTVTILLYSKRPTTTTTIMSCPEDVTTEESESGYESFLASSSMWSAELLLAPGSEIFLAQSESNVKKLEIPIPPRPVVSVGNARRQVALVRPRSPIVRPEFHKMTRSGSSPNARFAGCNECLVKNQSDWLQRVFGSTGSILW